MKNRLGRNQWPSQGTCCLSEEVIQWQRGETGEIATVVANTGRTLRCQDDTSGLVDPSSRLEPAQEGLRFLLKAPVASTSFGEMTETSTDGSKCERTKKRQLVSYESEARNAPSENEPMAKRKRVAIEIGVDANSVINPTTCDSQSATQQETEEAKVLTHVIIENTLTSPEQEVVSNTLDEETIAATEQVYVVKHYIVEDVQNYD